MFKGKSFNILYALLLLVLGVANAALADESLPENVKDKDGLPYYSAWMKLSPSIYDAPFFNLDRNYQCAAGERKYDAVSADGLTLAKLCRKDYFDCQRQGSCVVIRGGQRLILSFRKGSGNFVVITNARCPYGCGAYGGPVIPFHTVAADAVHQNGEIIFLPEVKGTPLPDGTKHDGFFIVTDKFGKSMPESRFDFYTGFSSAKDPLNPFVRKGLSDPRHAFFYLKVVHPVLRAKILARYRYPLTETPRKRVKNQAAKLVDLFR